MSIHSATDERIVDLIFLRGRAFYHQITVGLKDVDDRLIDRRLQALKKKDRIEYLGPSFGWKVK